MKDKITTAIEYYNFKKNELLDFVNNGKNLSADEIIKSGIELQTLEYKITALEVAKEN